MTNTTFKSRITDILDSMNRSKSWLADRIGLSRQAFNYLINHTNGEKYAYQIAEALNISPEWLCHGEGNLIVSANLTNQIPLLKLNNVINWISGELNDFYETLSTEYNETSGIFAAILDNSSMEPEFFKDSILIFRSFQKPSNGDYVLAKLNKNTEQQLVFRRYFADGSGIYLKALDPTFRTITENDDFDIIGTLIEHRRKFHD